MAAKKKVAAEAAPVIAYKGFDKDLRCNGGAAPFQYAVGETYTHKGTVVACRSGFHVCTDPFDVWSYYPPGQGNRFAQVEVSGVTEAHEGDSKLAVETLRVTAELSLFAFVKVGVDAILKRAKDTKKETGNYSAATNTGNQSAATNTGSQSAATNTGYRSAATNTGYQSAATNTGYRSAATNTGSQSAATNTGYQSAATNTGDYSAASVEGKHSVALASGFEGRVSSGIAAVERSTADYATILSAAIGIVGKDGIEAGKFYVCQGGKLVEAK